MKSIQVEELLERKLSWFKSVKITKRSSDISFRQFLEEIGGTKHEELVHRIRKESDEKKQDSLKLKLPGVMLSGVGNRKLRDAKTEPTFEHSGLLQLDFDLKDNPSIGSEGVFDDLKSDPHVLALFRSPRGGLKGVVAIPRSVDAHEASFLSADEHFSSKYSLKMDPKPKNRRSLCFLSYDPESYLADIEVELFQPTPNATQKHRNAETQNNRNSSESHTQTIFQNFDMIEEVEEKEERWLQDPSSDPIAVSLWKEFIFDRYEPDFSKRNEILVNFIKYAHSRMSRKSVMILAKQIHELWGNLFRGDLASHMRSAESLWDGCETTFRSEVGEVEIRFYLRLQSDDHRDTFRICRDLALRKKGGIGCFFLSARNLGVRMGFEHTRAWHNIRRFKKLGLIEEFRKGTQGSKGRATEFKWMLGP
tara:strand:- start:329 stop:1591 length:1263 start_codon:yes stop_codon:yes gene_type:complete